MINGPQVSSELNGDLESGFVAHDSPEELNADTSRKGLPSPREVSVEISPQAGRILEEPTDPHPEGSKSQNSCAICLEDFKPAEKEDVRRTSCGHTFHFNCLNTHIETQRHNGWEETCPMCRAALSKGAKRLSHLEVEVNTPEDSVGLCLCKFFVLVTITTLFVSLMIYGISGGSG